MNHSKLISICSVFLFFITISISAQSTTTDANKTEYDTTKSETEAKHFCGKFPKHNAMTKDKSKLFYDRFGNSYDIDEESKKQSLNKNSSSVVAGYFFLIFDNSIPQSYRDISCTVFEELSDILIKRSYLDGCGAEVLNPLFHQIQIVDDENEEEDLPPNVLAAATPFYTHSPQYECKSIAYSNFHKKMNGLETGSSADGKIILDMDKSHLYDTSFPNNPAANLYDFYTIMFHEALHIVGFESLIAQDQGSNFTPFDLLLQNQNSNAITSDCTSACFHLDPNIELDSDLLPCAYTVGALGPGISGGPANDINSWSHLGGVDCGDPDYLMYPILDTGERKFIHADEIQILCDLGYETISCSADCFLVAPKNLSSKYSECCNTFFHSCDSDLAIDFTELLCHSFSNQDVNVVDAISVFDNGNPLDITITGSSINIHSDKKGRHWIQITYALEENCNCRTYTSLVELNFDLCQQGCDLVYCENLLCFGDVSRSPGDILSVINFGYPFIFETQFQNTPDLYSEGLHIYGDKTESVILQINDENREDCTYLFSVDVKNRRPTIATNLEIWFSDQPPCDPNDRYIPYECGTTVDCENYSYTTQCFISEPIIGDDFNRYEFEIPKNYSLGNFNYMWLSNTGAMYPSSLTLNNFSLTKECGSPGFWVEQQDCNIYSFVPYTNAWVGFDWTISGSNNYIDEISIPIGSNGTLSNYNFTENGTYEITLVTTDECGYTTVTTETIEIDCEGDEPACYYEACILGGNQPHITGIFPPVPNMNYPYCMNTSYCVGGIGYQRFIDDLNANLTSGSAHFSYNHPLSECRHVILFISDTNIPFQYVEITDFSTGILYTIDLEQSNCNNIQSEVVLRSDASTEVQIYPNPTGDYLFLNTDEEIKGVNLFRFDGTQISDITLVANRIDLAHVNTGVYILQIQKENETVTRKITKL